MAPDFSRDPVRRASHRSGRLLATTALAGAAALVLAGCAGGEASGGSGDRPQIVATTTQVADFARELVGDQAEVTQLLEPGQSAHSFDPSAGQLLAISRADAVLVNGAGLETWLDDALDSAGFDGPVVDASQGVELFGTDDHDHDEHAEDEHAEEPADEASDHDDHDDHDHDHADGNPHIWTSPANATRMVENLADGLAEVPGIDADAVRTAEAGYTARLADLDAWIRENVEQVPVEQRLLVTNHDAFTYFLHEYDITLVGSVIPSFDDNAEPSAAEIDDLVEKIRATGVQAVFAEQAISPKTAATIAREAGVTVYSGDDALYGDALGAAGTEGATYLGSTVHNVRLMLESWGVEASEPPASLRG
ncbi:zinc ABC transporter substrate-binding protein [Agromyces intestinalis]|uniref:Zinc ABC transporter substrate-binding protein n=1 Tax=Agromyces intestinalis TaxID=2592652 RepID=A0A5C1YHL4_9MICO|nr:metal ABC transporter substrate-binding protein [Agromyces intestinalis]QEO14579.1 zinc ABC transporter substrate-binding protein [Agromyces intestinalis]